MLLRASGEHDGLEHSFDAVNGEALAESQVAETDVLIPFAEACIGADRYALPQSRTQLLERMGEAALVDAAAVVAIFNAVVRIADATGVPLEDAKYEASSELRQRIGINALRSG